MHAMDTHPSLHAITLRPDSQAVIITALKLIDERCSWITFGTIPRSQCTAEIAQLTDSIRAELQHSTHQRS